MVLSPLLQTSVWLARRSSPGVPEDGREGHHPVDTVGTTDVGGWRLEPPVCQPLHGGWRPGQYQVKIASRIASERAGHIVEPT